MDSDMRKHWRSLIVDEEHLTEQIKKVANEIEEIKQTKNIRININYLKKRYTEEKKLLVNLLYKD